jgi:hypothetical protein
MKKLAVQTAAAAENTASVFESTTFDKGMPYGCGGTFEYTDLNTPLERLSLCVNELCTTPKVAAHWVIV